MSTDREADRVPSGVVERLPSYLNALLHLRGEGCQTVSSARLSELAEVNAAQIRRDLAYFGQFGIRGVGYDIASLADQIQHILGSDHVHGIAIVGAGNLGSALACYDGLRTRGFVVSALFDSDPDKVGALVGDLIVRDVGEAERVVAEQGVRFGSSPSGQRGAGRGRHTVQGGRPCDSELLHSVRSRVSGRDAAQYRSS